jgi:signal transduction histidine kinase/ActR/RegA family two-component response regulator
LWATDVGKDARASKGPAKIGSREIGIHGAFVFPIVSDGRAIGLLNFASRKAREPEPQLLEAISAVGAQIGQFVQRRQADEQRRTLEAQLRQAQKLQAIGTLATGIAHEFNNALRAILANVELARMDVGPEHPVRESIEEIDRAGRRAKDFVQRILAFARPEARRRRYLVLGEIAHEAAKLMRAALPPKIELDVEIGRDAPPVLADATQIHQLLVNLCTNAWQAIPGDSGRIVIGVSGIALGEEALHLTPGLRPGEYAHLSVSDSGIGIEPLIRERLFEPFFSTKPVGEGTGLGLAIVHGIVQAHEGTIEVESELGRGTIFHIYLPATPERSERRLGEREAVRTRGKGRHVLFLDDNRELTHAMERSLPRHGFRVSSYTVPEAALDAVRAAPQAYDLILTDYKLPGLSGLDVAREISRIRPDLPVVVISGYVDDELRRMARALGVRQVLNKLHTLDELVGTIDRLTKKARAHQESSE